MPSHQTPKQFSSIEGQLAEMPPADPWPDAPYDTPEEQSRIYDTPGHNANLPTTYEEGVSHSIRSAAQYALEQAGLAGPSSRNVPYVPRHRRIQRGEYPIVKPRH